MLEADWTAAGFDAGVWLIGWAQLGPRMEYEKEKTHFRLEVGGVR
jgi:hypothetical protein